MDVIRRFMPAFVASVAIFGQTSPARPEFEVASIKPSPPLGGAQVNIGLHIDGAQVHCNSLSLKDYIRMAYRVKDYQISGPEWLASARFDIAAKLPTGAVSGQVLEMLQALLADRFQVKIHRETKEFPVYGLVVAKSGLKMKESPADVDRGTASGRGDDSKAPVNVNVSGGRGGTTVDMGKGSYFTFANDRFEAKKLTMAGLADTLARFVDRPVVDMTELKGNYDFTLAFSPEDFRAMMIRSAIVAGVALPPQALQALEGVSGDSLFKALETLGLRLEPRKAPLELLVIDHAEKMPTDN